MTDKDFSVTSRIGGNGCATIRHEAKKLLKRLPQGAKSRATLHVDGDEISRQTLGRTGRFSISPGCQSPDTNNQESTNRLSKLNF